VLPDSGDRQGAEKSTESGLQFFLYQELLLLAQEKDNDKGAVDAAPPVILLTD